MRHTFQRHPWTCGWFHTRATHQTHKDAAKKRAVEADDGECIPSHTCTARVALSEHTHGGVASLTFAYRRSERLNTRPMMLHTTRDDSHTQQTTQ